LNGEPIASIVWGCKKELHLSRPIVSLQMPRYSLIFANKQSEMIDLLLAVWRHIQGNYKIAIM
jgi:hypothetical protein